MTGASRRGLLTLPGRPRARRLPAGRQKLVSVLLGLSGWAVLGLTAVIGPGPLRSLLVIAFALAVPGLAVTRLLRVGSALERAVLAAALSMSLAALTAEGAYIAHALDPAVVLAVLALVTTVAAAARLWLEVKPG